MYGEFEIRISHTSIFDAILKQCEPYFDRTTDAAKSHVRKEVRSVASISLFILDERASHTPKPRGILRTARAMESKACFLFVF